MGIKRPFSARMLMGGHDISSEPIADVMDPPWKYVNRINEAGDEVRTLYHYNNTYGGEEVVVPYGYTELQDYYSSSNNSYNTLPFFSHTKLTSVDSNNVPFRNNSMRCAFYNCRDLVSVTNINDSVTNMSHTFYYCRNLNQPITIPDNVTNMTYTFYSCINFNQPITIPDSVTNMSCTFYRCIRFNQPLTIPESVTDMTYTFFRCDNFNQPITIPGSVVSMYKTFLDCTGLGGEGLSINILSTEITNAIDVFKSCSNNLRRNVYTYFTYANGENTKTYNSLTSAGYSTTGIDNTYLMDLGTAP